jgi:hypothetical protein
MSTRALAVRWLPLLLLVGAFIGLALARIAQSAPPPAPPDPTCSPGPADCNAWHREDVTVNWSPPPPGVAAIGCDPVTINSDAGGAPVSCTWANADGSRTTTVLVRRDASPPAVTANPQRGPDSDGWYNRAISVSFAGDDATSGVASCTSATYSGPDTGSVSINGSCSDNAGNRGGTSLAIKFDATPPTVRARPDRQPNRKGWYNRQVTVAFVGSDAMSGLHSCVAPVTYRGPDAPKTAVSGTCTDKAANQSPPAAFELRYDTRPPVLGRIKAELRSQGVVLRWRASKDADAFSIMRRPGLKGKRPSVVYTGKARAFTDRRLTKGVKYRYTVTAYDEAGNGAVKGLAVRSEVSTKPTRVRAPSKPAARPALTRPAERARLAAPPRLTWRAVPNATYYNVQLYRNGRKILTAWPTSTSFLLTRSWRHDGRVQHLTPGRYRWYVWPGLGARSANRYGKLLGTRTFIITRA